jgi:hypothetical protein
METEMQWEDNGAGTPVFCGASSDSSTGHFWLYGRTGNTQRMGYLSRGKTISGIDYPIKTWTTYRVTTELDNGIQKIVCKRKDDSGKWVDYGSASEAESGPNDAKCNLYLFAENANGTAGNFCQARCYHLKLWQKDSQGKYRLVRYLVPVITPSNAAAFFDLVEEKYYYNKGTQGFEKGSSENYIPFGTGASFSVK